MAFDNDTLTLSFKHLYKEKLEEIENHRVVEKIISNFLGHACQVQCVLENGNNPMKEALKLGAQIEVEEYMNFEQIRQAQALKSKLDKAQKELKKMQIEGEAGKGAVTVVVNGEQKIISVKIAPEVVDPKNVKQLEQLIIKAVNDAQEKAQKAAAEQLKEVTGGLKIPGLF